MNAFELSDRLRTATPRLTALPMIERGIAVLILLLYSQALLGPLLAGGSDPDAGEVLRLIWPPVYLVTLMLAATRPSAMLRYMGAAWPILLLVGLAVVSASWSLDPGLTLRRSVAIVFPTLFAIWLAAAFSWRDLLRILATTFGILAVGSVLAAVVFPGFGVMHEIHVGAWRGLWWEKNTLGVLMASGVLAFVAAGAIDREHARLWRFLVPVGILLVLMSTSKTGLLAMLVGLGVPTAIALIRRDFSFATLAFSGLFLAIFAGGVVLVVGPAVVLEALGRDATLTGRTDIWVVLIEMIRDRPWTGYGYGAFWQVEGGPVFWVEQATQWAVPSAHNAWLEVSLSIGLPGLVLSLFVYLRAVTHGLERVFRGPETYWALSYYGVWAVISMSESALIQQNSMGWTMFCVTAIKLAGTIRDHRRAAP